MGTTILSNREFFGKLLLFGEHSVIEGSGALVIPYPDVSGGLVFPKQVAGGEGSASNRTLNRFSSWLKENDSAATSKLDITRFIGDIENGLYFRSTIPEGYGLGSSGALCAAVYNEYGEAGIKPVKEPDPGELLSVKKTLASMESWFHGTSSGIDPLCIYYSKPLIIGGKEDIKIWDVENTQGQGLHIFLIDTGLKGNTGELVTAFRNKLRGQSLKESFSAQYIPLVNEVVEQFAGGRPEYDSLVQLSLFQWRIFQEMIPDRFREVWQYGLDWEYYTLKLLGSGGGGYLLGFTQDMEYARRFLLERFDIEPVEVRIR
jgi:mevalonate kinase